MLTIPSLPVPSEQCHTQIHHEILVITSMLNELRVKGRRTHVARATGAV